MDNYIIQQISPLITLLQVESGYVNNKDEVYDESGIFIDFLTELGSKVRKNKVPVFSSLLLKKLGFWADHNRKTRDNSYYYLLCNSHLS